MRIYTSLKEAKSEIVRDLSRSLVQTSTRVQSKVELSQVHEAVGYSYLVHGHAFPKQPHEFVAVGLEMLPLWKKWEAETPGVMRRWFVTELGDRVRGRNGIAPQGDKLHPELAQYLMDGEPNYTYQDRLPNGWVNRVSRILQKNPDSRRIFIPIYQPMDFGMADQEFRIPCTIGYGFRFRHTEDGRDHLEVSLLQRSVDLNKFWFSDLGFAYYMGVAVQVALAEASIKFYKLRASDVSVLHTILSFHSFLQDEGEIF